MDNTDIKKIWEQGFQHQKTELPQQEINNIMKRKSAHIVDKIKSTINQDQKAMPYVGLAVVLPLLFLGHYKFGLFLAGVFAALYYLNMHMIEKLYAIEIKDNSLQYLLSVRSLFQYLKAYYTRLLGIGLPLVAVPAFLFSLDLAGIPMEEFLAPEDRWLSFTIIVVCAGLFSVMGILSYRLSTQALYGKDLRRIDEIIEELRNGQAAE